MIVKGGKLTLRVPGDGGLISKVAKAGEPVSPALISPPSPLDLLRAFGLSKVVGPARGGTLSALDSRGNASVAVMITSFYNAKRSDLIAPKNKLNSTAQNLITVKETEIKVAKAK